MEKMYNKRLIILLFISFLIFTSISPILSNVSAENNGSIFLINNIDEDNIKISVNVPDFDISIINENSKNYALFSLPGESFCNDFGQAKLPKIRRYIEIPQDAIPNIKIVSVKWEYTSLRSLKLPAKILPVQPFILKAPNTENEFTIDDKYYSSNQYLPQNIAEIIDIFEIRDRKIALLEISPISYNPCNGYLKLMDSCEISIDLINTNIEKTKSSIQRYSSQSFEELFDSMITNYGYYEGLTAAPLSTEVYLIIVYDDFFDEITPLADWKTTLGYDVTVTKTSEIPGGVTTTNIKAYIQEAYDTWTTPPAYILLVGDTPQIPAFSSNGGVTDTPFVTMDEDDFADIHIGRFPADTETHVETMVDKTIYYEQGNFATNDWIKKAAFLASVDNYEISEGTHNYVIDTHLEPNGYICDRLYQVTYGANTQDVRDSINDGRSLVIYSGHGSSTSWGDGPPFSQSDINGLTNADMYPFVCSHSCLTGKFSIGECFGETWVRAPDKGAIAFWGSSINTQWIPDDYIERRMFDAWWEDGLERIGQMTDKGMYDAYLNYGSGMIQFVKSYNVLGDASIKLWSDDPFTPDHDIQLSSLEIDPILYEDTTYTVSTTVTNIGLNAENNIIVDFKIDEAIIDSTTIDSLNSMQSIQVSFGWNPSDPGIFTVKIESEPITDEYDLLNNVVSQDVTVLPEGTGILDIEQAIIDRGFPIRYATDGSWGAAQSFKPTTSTLTRVDIYMRKFGTPSFDFTVELRDGSINGPILDTIVLTPNEIEPSFSWVALDFADTIVTSGNQYFIKVLPPTTNPGNSFGYEWGYAFGNQYDDGAFWFTRDGGGLWRDLPAMYEFTFRTYGIN